MKRYSANLSILQSIHLHLPRRRNGAKREFLTEEDLELYIDSELFKKFFVFCQDNLVIHAGNLGMQKTIFCFERNDGLNAWAYRNEGVYVISMYDSYFQTLKRKIIDDNPLVKLKDFDDKYGRLLSKISVRIEDVIFASATLFTYYHEQAHLVQLSSKHNGVSFEKDGGSVFSHQKHIYEFDADLHGGHSVCFHLIDYLSNSDIQDREDVELLMSIGLASILITRLIFEEFKADTVFEPIYLADKSHPHTVVRAVYILDHMVTTVNNNLPHLNLVGGQILRNCFDLVSDFFSTEALREFLEEFYYEPKPIEDYINYLNTESEKYHELVRFQHHKFDAMNISNLLLFLIDEVPNFENPEMILVEGECYHYTPHWQKIKEQNKFKGAKIDSNLDQTQSTIVSKEATESKGVVFAYENLKDAREEGFGLDIVKIHYRTAIKALHKGEATAGDLMVGWANNSGIEMEMGTPHTFLILTSDIISFEFVERAR